MTETQLKEIEERFNRRNEGLERFYGRNRLEPGEADKLIKIIDDWNQFQAAFDMYALIKHIKEQDEQKSLLSTHSANRRKNSSSRIKENIS